MVTKPEESVTLSNIIAELADLEVTYKARRKKLRALLAVLEDEADNIEMRRGKPDAQ